MAGFEGKVVLVTGAGKGAGRCVAEAFSMRGATLAVNDISPVNLDETVAHIIASDGRVQAYVEDIAKKMSVQALLNTVLDDFGRIDILVNCAEVEPQKSVLEMDDWDWQRTLDVNLNGAFLLTQSAGRVMKEKGGGVIVHVSEKVVHSGTCAAYSASKAGLESLVCVADEEFSAFGVRVLLARTAEEALEACSQ